MSRGREIAVDRLQHMVEAVRTIESYVCRGRAAFDREQVIRDAILYQIVILGEAAKAAIAVDPSIEQELPEVEWSPIVRMRDRVAHHYWATDSEVVWSTVTEAVPELGRAVPSALDRLQ